MLISFRNRGIRQFLSYRGVEQTIEKGSFYSADISAEIFEQIREDARYEIYKEHSECPFIRVEEDPTVLIEESADVSYEFKINMLDRLTRALSLVKTNERPPIVGIVFSEMGVDDPYKEKEEFVEKLKRFPAETIIILDTVGHFPEDQNKIVPIITDDWTSVLIRDRLISIYINDIVGETYNVGPFKKRIIPGFSKDVIIFDGVYDEETLREEGRFSRSAFVPKDLWHCQPLYEFVLAPIILGENPITQKIEDMEIINAIKHGQNYFKNKSRLENISYELNNTREQIAAYKQTLNTHIRTNNSLVKEKARTLTELSLLEKEEEKTTEDLQHIKEKISGVKDAFIGINKWGDICLFVQTTEIVIDNEIDIGELEIEIPLKDNSSEVYIKNLTWEPVEGMPHPHVRGNYPCWGNSTDIEVLLIEKEYSIAIEMILRFLRTFNIEDEYGIGIISWDEEWALRKARREGVTGIIPYEYAMTYFELFGEPLNNMDFCTNCGDHLDDCMCPRCPHCLELEEFCECIICEECDELIEDCQCERCEKCEEIIEDCTCDRCEECGELMGDCGCSRCIECEELIEECECEDKTEEELEEVGRNQQN